MYDDQIPEDLIHLSPPVLGLLEDVRDFGISTNMFHEATPDNLKSMKEHGLIDPVLTPEYKQVIAHLTGKDGYGDERTFYEKVARPSPWDTTSTLR